jgi:hypothetical protein
MEIFLYFIGTTLLGFILGKWDCSSQTENTSELVRIDFPIKVSAEEIRLRQKFIELTYEVSRLNHIIWHLKDKE